MNKKLLSLSLIVCTFAAHQNFASELNKVLNGDYKHKLQESQQRLAARQKEEKRQQCEQDAAVLVLLIALEDKATKEGATIIEHKYHGDCKSCDGYEVFWDLYINGKPLNKEHRDFLKSLFGWTSISLNQISAKILQVSKDIHDKCYEFGAK